MDRYQNRITIDAGKRGGKPCIRGMRITVYDILGWLAAGMSYEEILDDFPDLKLEDILEIEPNPGPGSFTGIKVGITIANVLNWITGKKGINDLAVPEYGKQPNIQK